jgi:hypothetical protein
MSATLTYLTTYGSGAAAFYTKAPTTDTRTSTHFIALIDISESMADKSKLVHVKHCMRLLLTFLTSDDALSLVTFGEDSEIVLNRVQTSSNHIPSIEKAISSLRVDGCTNYSSGLASVRQILKEAAEANCTLKPGLLSFTDGHANRGAHRVSELNSMVCRIHELYPALSFSFVGYGTDHNADMMKTMADSVMGSYSVVDSLESAATAMGDCLGSILSCVAQNVYLECPLGSSVEGPYIMDAKGRILLGDLYSGTDITILLNLKPGPVTFSGVSLPDLDTFSEVVVTTLDTSQNIAIDVTRLRYRCSELFHQIREQFVLNSDTRLREEIMQFRDSIRRPELVGHPVIAVLESEVNSMLAALEIIRSGGMYTSGLHTQLTQHAAFTANMRGTTTSILPEVRRGRVRFNSAASDPDHAEPAAPSAERAPHIVMSPMSSTRQRNVTEQMRAASIGGGDPSS